MLHKRSIIPCLLHGIKCQTFFYSKAFHLCSDKSLHHGSAAQLFSDIPAETSYISTLGTTHVKCYPRKICRKYLNTVYRNRSWLPFYDLPGSCKLIKLLAIYLDGRIHRWDLHVIPDKTHHCLNDCLLIRIDVCHICEFTCDILRITGLAKQHRTRICLILLRQKITHLCGTSKTHKKNSLRHGIESSGMTYLFLF